MLNRKHKSMYCLRKGNRNVCVSERERNLDILETTWNKMESELI